MKKRKMEHFFAVQPKPDQLHRKHFIYAPEQHVAFFAKGVEASDVFVGVKSGLKMYLRPSISPLSAAALPMLDCHCTTPLLKSNMQKAIRRGKTEEAIQSTIVVLQRDQDQLLRRLPIIMLEDVTVFDSLPLCVWLMMVGKDYSLTAYDQQLVLQIVRSLCECTDAIPEMSHVEAPFTHEALQDHPQGDVLLALHYRSLYGGMQCDVQMLRNAIGLYLTSAHPVARTSFEFVDCSSMHSASILPESIDFHPFPQMLTIIQKKCEDLSKEEIKSLIWFAESGVNIRKPESVAKANACQRSESWKRIASYLPVVRKWMKDIRAS